MSESTAAEEIGVGNDEIQPWVVARSLIGLHQALVDFSRRQILAGVRNPTLARRVRRRGERAVELLASGLDTYGTRAEA